MRNDTSTPAMGQVWNGWARSGPRAAWKLLVRAAASQAEAMEKLRAMTATSRFIDLTVTRAGVDPNNPPTRPAA